MESLKELYRIGSGPSSSHTMGPKRAAERFAERCRDVDAYRVTLYGSLAATGKGHLTDVAILSVLEPAAPTRIVWKPEVVRRGKFIRLQGKIVTRPEGCFRRARNLIV